MNQAVAPIENSIHIEQEHTRAHAGRLLDENNTHRPVMSRINKRSNELDKDNNISPL